VAKFDRSKLSDRENEILDLAIDGLTDAQMAQKLGIALSTVNSYWVRIRGKLRYFSRTEFVSLALRAKAKGEIQRVVQESEDLARQLRMHETAGTRSEGWYLFRMALEAVPDALFVCSSTGNLLFANGGFLSMFGYSRAEAENLRLRDLFFCRALQPFEELLSTAVSDSRVLRLGIDEVVYCRKRDGHETRVLLHIGVRSDDLDTVFTGIVRNFVDEVDARRKFVSSFAHLS
jgi:PAS domain S-box-containing protein